MRFSSPENSFQAHKRQIPRRSVPVPLRAGQCTELRATRLDARVQIFLLLKDDISGAWVFYQRASRGDPRHHNGAKQNPFSDEFWCPFKRTGSCAAASRLCFDWREVKTLGHERQSKHGISLLGSDAVRDGQEAIRASRAAQPPLQLLSFSRG